MGTRGPDTFLSMGHVLCLQRKGKRWLLLLEHLRSVDLVWGHDRQTYEVYIFKVFRQVRPKNDISSKEMFIMNYIFF
jgi:hypothetical protein